MEPAAGHFRPHPVYLQPRQTTSENVEEAALPPALASSSSLAPPSDAAEQTLAKVFNMLGLDQMNAQHEAQERQKQADYKRNLRAEFPAIYKMMPLVGTKGSDSLLAKAKTNVLEKKDLATEPLVSSLHKIPSVKDAAQDCLSILKLIALELEYLQLAHEWNVSETRGKLLQDILWESFPTKFFGDLFATVIPSKMFELNSTESFAFFLRFTKKFNEAKNALEQVFDEKDENIFRWFAQKGDPAIDAQMKFFSFFMGQNEEFKKGSLIVERLAPVLSRMEAFVTDPRIFDLCRQFTPGLAFLSALDMDLCEKTTHQGTYDPEKDLRKNYYLPLRKQFLKDLSRHYLDRQITLYKKVHAYLQQLINIDPQLHHESLQEPQSYQAMAENQRNTLRLTANDKSEQIAQELMQEETQRAATAVKKQAHAVARKKTVKRETPKQNEKSAAAKSPANPSKEIPHLTKILMHTLQKPSPLHYHDRVQRWLKLPVEQFPLIKTFKDRCNGQEVFKYADLPDQELKIQHTLHGFSTLVDYLLGHAELKKKYCYPTPRGLALFVELIPNQMPVKRGVLHLGLDQSLCYHRKIDLKKDVEFQELSFEQLAEDNWDDVEDMVKQQSLKEELASGFVGDEVKLLEHMEIIAITDKKHQCQLRIFPLN